VAAVTTTLIDTTDFCLGTLPAYLASGRDCLGVSAKIRFGAGELSNPGFWVRQLREQDAGEANNDEYRNTTLTQSTTSRNAIG
jgi:hypothetical protein